MPFPVSFTTSRIYRGNTNVAIPRQIKKGGRGGRYRPRGLQCHSGRRVPVSAVRYVYALALVGGLLVDEVLWGQPPITFPACGPPKIIY